MAVRWDHGVENKYRVGADGKYDLIVVGRRGRWWMLEMAGDGDG